LEAAGLSALLFGERSISTPAAESHILAIRSAQFSVLFHRCFQLQVEKFGEEARSNQESLLGGHI